MDIKKSLLADIANEIVMDSESYLSYIYTAIKHTKDLNYEKAEDSIAQFYIDGIEADNDGMVAAAKTAMEILDKYYKYDFQ